MQSKRKPYFAGNTVPLKGDAGGILYNRYTDPGEILLDAEPAPKQPVAAAAPVEKKEKKEKKRKAAEEMPPSAAVEANDDAGEAPKPTKERKKPRWSEEKKAAAKAERDAAKAAAGETDGEAAAEPKKKKDKKTKDSEPVIRKLAPEERVSGPGNAEEAEKIRQTLGFVSAPAAAAPPPPGGVFAFGFNAAAATNGTATANKPADSSSSDDSSSSSDSEAEDEIKVKPAAAPSSSDSESDDSSSSESEREGGEEDAKDGSGNTSDDGSSSSDSDGDEEHPAQQQQQQWPVSTGAAPAPAPDASAPPSVSPLESEFVPRRVYVGGMPYSYTESQVREFWEYCGPIESLDLLTFPDTGRFRGIAFITFATEEGYTAALGCDGEACDGQTVKVQKCKWSAKDRRAAMAAQTGVGGQIGASPAQHAQQPQYQTAVPPPGADDGMQNRRQPPGGQYKAPAPKTAGYDVAYVGNVAYEADEGALKALFEPFNVTKVRLHTDKDTGKPKGFAHIHFKDESSLDAAMSLDGTILMGRRIKVGYAQPKKEQSAA